MAAEWVQASHLQVLATRPAESSGAAILSPRETLEDVAPVGSGCGSP
jgi:hypothetical protein